ncbi:MAG: inositol oxygenase family protein [Pseudomonadales bacterium]
MASQTTDNFRDYQRDLNDPVAQFYFDNHRHQTLDFARGKLKHYATLNRKQMSVWQAMQLLDSIVDDSDPDTELSQLDHSLQTAEAIRAAGEPRWLQLTGFIHDLGKVLCCFEEPQWAVVGDTFPLGCRFDQSIVYSEFFAENPDHQRPEYQTETGIYSPHCGLDAVTMSWGHDEYLYQVTRQHLPAEALYVIRYHSFYSAHSAGAYQHLMNEFDQQMMPWVQKFQPFDLYSKGESAPDRAALLPYYQTLVTEFLPDQLNW